MNLHDYFQNEIPKMNVEEKRKTEVLGDTSPAGRLDLERVEKILNNTRVSANEEVYQSVDKLRVEFSEYDRRASSREIVTEHITRLNTEQDQARRQFGTSQNSELQMNKLYNRSKVPVSIEMKPKKDSHRQQIDEKSESRKAVKKLMSGDQVMISNVVSAVKTDVAKEMGPQKKKKKKRTVQEVDKSYSRTQRFWQQASKSDKKVAVVRQDLDAHPKPISNFTKELQNMKM